MEWFTSHLSDIVSLTLQHLYLAGLPLVFGLLIAIPVGWLATRFPSISAPVVVGTGLLYTIPSLALFILMPLFIGTRILDPVNVLVAMTVYTVALLVRTVVDALSTIPEAVAQSATAMGIGRIRRLFAVELPIAVPVIGAGLRVAAVSNVSIVSVAAIIGVPQLGSLFTDGFRRSFADPIIVGIVACVVLALFFDLLIVVVARLLTPWQNVRKAA